MLGLARRTFYKNAGFGDPFVGMCNFRRGSSNSRMPGLAIFFLVYTILGGAQQFKGARFTIPPLAYTILKGAQAVATHVLKWV